MKLSTTDRSIMFTLSIIRLSCFFLIASSLQKDINKKKELITVKENKVITVPKMIVNKPEIKQQAIWPRGQEKYPALKCEKLVNIRSQLLKRLKIETLPKIKVKKEVRIAVIDTGLNINISAFHNRLYLPKDLIKDPKGYGIDYSTDTLSFQPADHHGHGSNVSGIIISLFPRAKILPIKYYNPKKSGNENLIAFYKSIQAAIDANVDIINISGGGPEPSVDELSILQKAKDHGILVVLAAGNERANINEREQFDHSYSYLEKHSLNSYYPASYNLDNMISVMNVEDNLYKAPSSNYGKNSVHLAAIGTKVYSYGSITDQNCASKMTGTSQSTPIVTATAAMIMAEFPHLSYKEVKQKVLDSTQKHNLLENLNSTSGLIDIKRSLANAKGNENERKH